MHIKLNYIQIICQKQTNIHGLKIKLNKFHRASNLQQ